VLFALNILLHLEQAANACLPPVDTTHPTNERPASRRQARQGPRARSVRGISRQDWEGSRARPASHRPKPWVPARIGAHRHGDRGREGGRGRHARSAEATTCTARARAAWTTAPAPSSPCAASPAPSTATPHRVRQRVPPPFRSDRVVVPCPQGGQMLHGSSLLQRTAWRGRRRGSGRASRASVRRGGRATRASPSI
jgi:hypothetical protein